MVHTCLHGVDTGGHATQEDFGVHGVGTEAHATTEDFGVKGLDFGVNGVGTGVQGKPKELIILTFIAKLAVIFQAPA